MRDDRGAPGRRRRPRSRPRTGDRHRLARRRVPTSNHLSRVPNVGDHEWSPRRIRERGDARTRVCRSLEFVCIAPATPRVSGCRPQEPLECKCRCRCCRWMAPHDRLNARIRRCPGAWGEGPPRGLLPVIQTARARQMPMQHCMYYGASRASTSAPGDGGWCALRTHVACRTHAPARRRASARASATSGRDLPVREGQLIFGGMSSLDQLNRRSERGCCRAKKQSRLQRAVARASEPSQPGLNGAPCQGCVHDSPGDRLPERYIMSYADRDLRVGPVHSLFREASGALCMHQHTC